MFCLLRGHYPAAFCASRHYGESRNPKKKLPGCRIKSGMTKQLQCLGAFGSTVCLGIIVSGCAIGPDYLRPTVAVPQAWMTKDGVSPDVINTAWWKQFQDPVLDGLIETALRENKDLLIAAARVEEFLGLYAETRSALFPQIGAGASGGRQRVTKETPNDLSPGTRTAFNNYNAILNASWELDIWGRIRRSTEAARADLVATEEGRRGVVLSLVAAVATTYIDLRSLDRQLEIAIDTAASRKASYELFLMRFQGGIISDLQLSQVLSQYEESLAVIPSIEKSIAFTEHSLSLLLGRNPGAITRGRALAKLALPEVPEGLPSTLLERRPDILQAEQNLIAANARIGVARSLYFPTISLTGYRGSESSHLSDLFSGPARIWSYAGQATMPLFTAGRIAGLVRASEAVRQQTLLQYEQAIQNAFRDVEDSLIDRMKTRERLDAQARQLEALRTYARVSRERFDEGYTSYIEVLDAERSLFNVELDYTQTQAVLLTSVVNIYKAMGGGWVSEADSMTAAASAEGDKK
jgi:multidrug efflux system outer membrane protein